MAAGEVSEPTWGDEVVVAADAPTEYRPGAKAWVVGLGVRDRDLLIIEFEDGTSVEISPSLLVPAPTE